MPFPPLTAFSIAEVDDLNDRFDATVGTISVSVRTSSGSYSKPAGLRFVHVRLVGGGGSGGGVAATAAGTAAEGGGGGGGGYSEELIPAASLAATETVTVGAGGAASTAGGAGNAGGTTSFGALLSATGGAGGNAGAAGAGPVATDGGAGGAGSGGDINIPGEKGGIGFVIATALALRLGVGGASLLSAQATMPNATSNGTAGQNYGGGSSGALNGVSQVARASLAGAPGIVIIIEYIGEN